MFVDASVVVAIINREAGFEEIIKRKPICGIAALGTPTPLDHSRICTHRSSQVPHSLMSIVGEANCRWT